MRMLILFLTLTLFIFSASASSRTGKAKIGAIVMKSGHTEFYMDGSAKKHNCGRGNQWILKTNHGNYAALVAALLTAKTNSTPVEMVGSTCSGKGMTLNWAYVAY